MDLQQRLQRASVSGRIPIRWASSGKLGPSARRRSRRAPARAPHRARPASAARHAEVDLAWVVGLRAVADTVAEARDRADMGYRTIKLKIGVDPDRDIAAVRAVREALPDIRLRVDANAGYALPTALRELRAVSGCALEVVEQPVAGRDVAGLARVRAETGLRIVADESLQTTADALALVAADACDDLNLKITKPGGLYRARQVAAIAEAAGLDVMVGSMPELGVATAAGLHLALSLPAQPYACEHNSSRVGGCSE